MSPSLHRDGALSRLPLDVAAALFEHVRGVLAANPRRVGKPLEAPYDGVWSCRRGEYRVLVLYTIDYDKHVITVVAAAHRRDAYRHR